MATHIIHKTLIALVFAITLLISQPVNAEAPIEQQEVIIINIPLTPKQYAKQRVTEEWGIEQWQYFDDLIQRESSWNYKASNPTSSARGLPQAMTSLHDLPEDYLTNPESQIDWGIQYIKSRHGTPYQSIVFHNLHNYY